MKTPTLLGIFIVGLSFIGIIIASFRLTLLFPDELETIYLEFFIIWLAGLFGGIGLGYGNRENFGFSENNVSTILGGIGLVTSFVISVLMFIFNTHPVSGVLLAFISSIIAAFGVYMVVISTQESY